MSANILSAKLALCQRTRVLPIEQRRNRVSKVKVFAQDHSCYNEADILNKLDLNHPGTVPCT